MDKKKISYIAVPAVLAGAMALVIFFAAAPAWKAGQAKWRAIWIMNTPEYSYQDVVEYQSDSFLPEQQTAGAGISGLAVGVQYGEIDCEKWDGSVPLYYGDSEELLEQGAGTYTGYGLPGEGTLILVGAHDTTYFSGLEKIEKGNVITIKTISGSFTYEVKEMEITDAAEASEKIAEVWEQGGTDQEELILYTCYPFGKTEDVRPQRYLIHAQRLTD